MLSQILTTIVKTIHLAHHQVLVHMKSPRDTLANAVLGQSPSPATRSIPSLLFTAIPWSLVLDPKAMWSSAYLPKLATTWWTSRNAAITPAPNSTRLKGSAWTKHTKLTSVVGGSSLVSLVKSSIAPLSLHFLSPSSPFSDCTTLLVLRSNLLEPYSQSSPRLTKFAALDGTMSAATPLYLNL